MKVVLIISILAILISITLIFYTMCYNKLQALIIRINQAEANIDTILRKRFDLIDKSVNIIKANTDYNSDILDNVIKLKSKKISNFELDRKIYEALSEFEFYKEKYPKLSNIKSFVKIANELEESEPEIEALRNYYNNSITKYNEMIKKFPSNILGKILKYNEKTYYDNKNLNDDIVNDFKL